MTQPFQTQDYRALLTRLGLVQLLIRRRREGGLPDNLLTQVTELEESILQEVFDAARREARECVVRGGVRHVSLPITQWCQAVQLTPEAFDEALPPAMEGGVG